MPLRALEEPADEYETATAIKAGAAAMHSSPPLPDEESLPEPRPRDEARLLVQSPDRLFFYWSFAHDPRTVLRRALGDAAGRYRLAVRLVEAQDGEESIRAVESLNSLWLAARPGKSYRAEVGFYSAELPFLCVLSSNVARTPTGDVSPVGDESFETQTAGQVFPPAIALTGAMQIGGAITRVAPRSVGDEKIAAAPSSYAWGLSARL